MLELICENKSLNTLIIEDINLGLNSQNHLDS